jgi:hypothetical protein
MTQRPTEGQQHSQCPVCVVCWKLSGISCGQVRLDMEDRFQSVIATICVADTLVLPGLLTAMFLGAR